MYGKQARAIINTSLSWFEKYVILYGKQAYSHHFQFFFRFEKYVILYGKQASKLLRKLRGIFERHMVVNLTAGLPALRRFERCVVLYGPKACLLRLVL